MKTASIKKCVAFLLLATIVCIDNTALAQIKVVDNSYAENLSATKSYYDRDVDFENYFPSVSKGNIYPYSSMYPSIIREHRTNLVGDTIYLCEPLSMEITNCNTSHYFKVQNGKAAVGKAAVSSRFITGSNPSATCGSFVMPSGYYLISGYVFCDDNEDALRSQVGLKPFNGGWTSRKLKKEILEEGNSFSGWHLQRYQRLLALKPLNRDTTTTYYWEMTGLQSGNDWSNVQRKLDHISVLQRFYNQITDFIGKEVFLVHDYRDWKGENDELIIIDEGTTDDDITGDPVKLEDVKFIVQDVVLKKVAKYQYNEYHVYTVLMGEKTGTFTKKIDCVYYVFSEDDLNPKERDKPNTINDVPVLSYYYGNDLIIKSNDLKKIKQRTKSLRAQKEREIKQQEAKEEAALARQMIAKFGAEYGGLIAKKQVSVGMTKEMCKAAWGYPMNTYRTTTRFGQSEVWCYNYKSRVYFFEGKVVQIDD